MQDALQIPSIFLNSGQGVFLKLVLLKVTNHHVKIEL